MDTNPTSSGTGDLAASLIASVGGQRLTLTNIFVWLRSNRPSEVAGLADDSAHRGKLAGQKPEFRLLRDIAKAQKHVHLTKGRPVVTRADQVSSRAIAFGEGDYGAGHFGGPPQVVADIDHGSFVYLENVVDEARGFLEAEMNRLGL